MAFSSLRNYSSQYEFIMLGTILKVQLVLEFYMSKMVLVLSRVWSREKSLDEKKTV